MAYKRCIGQFRKSMTYAIVAVMTLTSCAGQLAQYDKPLDPCNPYRQVFIDSKPNLAGWTAGGALAGAALGGAIAAIAGGNTGAIVGSALGGGFVGGTAGYLAAKRKEESDRQELLASINADAATDRTKVRELTTSVRSLGDCRRGQIAVVRRELQEGSISKDLARTKANEIQASIDEDNRMIAELVGYVDERFNTYVDAKAEVLQVDREQVVQPQTEVIVADQSSTAVSEDVAPTGASDDVAGLERDKEELDQTVALNNERIQRDMESLEAVL